MKNFNSRVFLSAICVASVLAGFTNVSAGPIRFDQVVQVVNAKPGKAQSGLFSTIRVAGDYGSVFTADDDDDKKKPGQTRQDGRVITETKSEIVEDDSCDCIEPVHRGFPKWYLLGLAAIPIVWILIDHKDKTPTPTPTIPGQTPTPTVTPTPPGMTPTPTPPITPTPTATPPPITPTPTPPQPVPEPVTILLFGTGLASVGLAARRKFGKKGNGEGEKEEK